MVRGLSAALKSTATLLSWGFGMAINVKVEAKTGEELGPGHGG